MQIKWPAKYTLFSLITVFYFLLVLWIKAWWLLAGLFLIFDYFFTKKIFRFNYKTKITGYKKKIYDFLIAIVIAFFIALFIKTFLFEAFKIPTPSMKKSLLPGDYILVNKIHYGPRMPITPLALPFMHNKIPGSNIKSYLKWINLPYKRLEGTNKIQRHDIVVFNYPLINYNKTNFSGIGNNHFNTPIDKKDIYVKRCVGIPGDTINIKHGKLYINNQPEKEKETYQYNYRLNTNCKISGTTFPGTNFSNEEIKIARISDYEYIFPLTKKDSIKISNNKHVVSLEKSVQKRGSQHFKNIFPHHPSLKWSRDNYGPIIIPGKYDTVSLTIDNLPLYEQIIKIYEKNKLKTKDSTIYINGKASVEYVFKMNYYWMMGDNRHQSMDSRYWGFVPENHIIGKAGLIWLSLSSKKIFPFNLRFNRTIKTIK